MNYIYFHYWNFLITRKKKIFYLFTNNLLLIKLNIRWKRKCRRIKFAIIRFKKISYMHEMQRKKWYKYTRLKIQNVTFLNSAKNWLIFFHINLIIRTSSSSDITLALFVSSGSRLSPGFSDVLSLSILPTH